MGGGGGIGGEYSSLGAESCVCDVHAVAPHSGRIIVGPSLDLICCKVSECVSPLLSIMCC